MRTLFRIIFDIAANAAALWVAAQFVPGFTLIPTPYAYFITAAILTATHLFLRPIVKFVLAPLIILTFGLLIVVVNASLLLLVDKFSTALTIEGLGSLLAATLIISIVDGILHSFTHPFLKRH